MKSIYYSEKLVQRVNELYHDFQNEGYHYSHPEIFEQEKERWERIAKQFFNFAKPVTLVDIGSGTGFVALTTAKRLKKNDKFICSDISRGILEIAKKNIKKRNFSCKFDFVKIRSQVPYRLPFRGRSVDVVAMNSVLHHVKDTETFLGEIDRILKPGGLLFIAHDMNRYFYENRFLWYNYLFFNYILDPKRLIYELLKKLRLRKIAGLYYFFRPKNKNIVQEHEKIVNKVNEALLKEKLIKKPISQEEIEEIIDVKVGEGFKPDALLPGYRLLRLETYNHIFFVTIRHFNNRIIKSYDSMLKRKYPKDGATFFAIYRKAG